MKPIPVRLTNDYGADWPLWDFEGGTGAEHWSLSPQLNERLAAWAAIFQEHFHEKHGFPTAEMAREHRAEGIALRSLVAEELGSRYEVIGEFWETDHPKRPRGTAPAR